MPAKHTPTEAMRQKVSELAGYGVPAVVIGKCIGISEPTMMQYYGEEFEKAKNECHATVIKCLFRAIKEGNTAAAFFYLKTQLGWRETDRIEHTGSIEFVARPAQIDRDKWLRAYHQADDIEIAA